MPAQQPEQLHRLFADGVNAKNIDALMTLYEPSPVAVDLEGRVLVGTDAVRELLSGLIAATTHFEVETRKVIVASDIALLSNTWHATVTSPDGQTMDISGMTAEAARRQSDGTLLLVIDDPRFDEPTRANGD